MRYIPPRYPSPTSHSFCFTHTATTEIYTLSLHDALPISQRPHRSLAAAPRFPTVCPPPGDPRRNRTPRCAPRRRPRSEEHTSELQSRVDLVCRLLLEKKKDTIQHDVIIANGHGLFASTFC